MSAYREVPDIGKTRAWESPAELGDDPMGRLWLPLVAAVSYFVLAAVFRVTSNSGSKLDRIVCYGTLILLVFVILLGARDTHRQTRAKHAERKAWAMGCRTALLTIVGRHEAISLWDDYSQRYHNSHNSLDLEMNSDHEAALPTQTVVSAQVSQYISDHLKERNTVRIYYMPEAPMAFLLEEEL
jgi:hypothetical protein